MRNGKPIIQKRQSFRTAIRKSKNWQKIRQRRPQMAGNTPTFVLVMWYNIDVIRWMPQRFLCAVNCIRDIFPNETTILRPSANCLGDQNWNQTSSKWISLIWTLKTKHSGLQVRWPMEGANMRRRDDGESRSDPRSAWTCQAKQARDDLQGYYNEEIGRRPIIRIGGSRQGKTPSVMAERILPHGLPMTGEESLQGATAEAGNGKAGLWCDSADHSL